MLVESVEGMFESVEAGWPWVPNWKSGLVARSPTGFLQLMRFGLKVQQGFPQCHSCLGNIDWVGPILGKHHPQVTDFLRLDTEHDQTRIGHPGCWQDLGSGRFGQLKEVEGFCCATCIAHCFYMDTSNQQHLTKWQSPLKSHSSTISCLTFRTAQYTALKTQLSLMKCDSLLGKIWQKPTWSKVLKWHLEKHPSC